MKYVGLVSISLEIYYHKVTIGLDLRNVIDMNERDQIITVNMWLHLTWSDYSLAWVPVSYKLL